jgi:hypothetical protein
MLLGNQLFPLFSLMNSQQPLGCLKSQNTLTAKFAEGKRKNRKELNNKTLTLRALRQLSVLCG